MAQVKIGSLFSKPIDPLLKPSVGQKTGFQRLVERIKENLSFVTGSANQIQFLIGRISSKTTVNELTTLMQAVKVALGGSATDKQVAMRVKALLSSQGKAFNPLFKQIDAKYKITFMDKHAKTVAYGVGATVVSALAATALYYYSLSNSQPQPTTQGLTKCNEDCWNLWNTFSGNGNSETIPLNNFNANSTCPPSGAQNQFTEDMNTTTSSQTTPSPKNDPFTEALIPFNQPSTPPFVSLEDFPVSRIPTAIPVTATKDQSLNSSSVQVIDIVPSNLQIKRTLSKEHPFGGFYTRTLIGPHSSPTEVNDPLTRTVDYFSDLTHRLPSVNFSDLTHRLLSVNFSDLTHRLPSVNFSDLTHRLPSVNFSDLTHRLPSVNFSDLTHRLPSVNFSDLTHRLPSINIGLPPIAIGLMGIICIVLSKSISANRNRFSQLEEQRFSLLKKQLVNSGLLSFDFKGGVNLTQEEFLKEVQQGMLKEGSSTERKNSLKGAVSSVEVRGNKGYILCTSYQKARNLLMQLKKMRSNGPLQEGRQLYNGPEEVDTVPEAIIEAFGKQIQ